GGGGQRGDLPPVADAVRPAAARLAEAVVGGVVDVLVREDFESERVEARVRPGFFDALAKGGEDLLPQREAIGSVGRQEYSSCDQNPEVRSSAIYRAFSGCKAPLNAR